MSTSSLTYRQSVTAEKQTLLRVLPTRWRRKPAGIDIIWNEITSLSSPYVHSTVHQALAFRSRKRGHVTRCRQWCIANNGGEYTQTGVAKGLKVPCLFMITEVSIRCQKNPGGWYTPYTRVSPPQYTTGCRSRGVGTMTSTR